METSEKKISKFAKAKERWFNHLDEDYVNSDKWLQEVKDLIPPDATHEDWTKEVYGPYKESGKARCPICGSRVSGHGKGCDDANCPSHDLPEARQG